MSKNPFSDPSVVDLRRRLGEKFAEKPAHSEVDVTFWSGSAVFLLHTFSALLATYAASFLGLSGYELTAVFIVWGLLACIIEWFKSQYSERYHNAFLKTYDETLPDAERERAYDRMKLTKNILLVFWTISLSVVVFSAAQMALKNAPSVVLLSYDLSIETTLKQKQSSLNIAQERNAKLATIKGLQTEVSEAQENWNRHKAGVDAENRQLKSTHSNGLTVYIFFGFLLGLGIEMAIFYMRRFHERKQYEIYKSLGELSKPTNAPVQSQPQSNGTITTNNNYDELLVKIKELQDAHRIKDDIIKRREADIRQLQNEKTVLENLVKPNNGNVYTSPTNVYTPNGNGHSKT